VLGKDDQNHLVEALEGMQETTTSDLKKKASAERKRHRTFFTKAAQ
jgi:hypothetical protein